MRSKIFTGHVMHARLAPLLHEFRYPVYFYAFDLDELPLLADTLPRWLFGYNRRALVSLHDSDYLDRAGGSIKEKLLRFLRENDCAEEIGRIELVTSARFFNYVFNPVSFYYCYSSSGELRYHVAEVNNTFGERHLYILKESSKEPRGFQSRYVVRKSFHVSPFNDMGGDYDFFFSELDDSMDVRLNIARQGEVVFRSRMWGDGSPLSMRTMLSTIARYPLTAALTMPRILWQAARLHYQRKLPVYRKPAPSSDLTIRVRPPRLRERFAMRMILGLFSRIREGTLHVRMPEGELKVFGEQISDASRVAHLDINEYSFFWRLLRGGAVALGETFQDGVWESDDVVKVLNLLIHNRGHLEQPSLLSLPQRVLLRLRHILNRNSRKGSRRNIGAHYDLSNDFFKLFLDSSLTYSSARFAFAGQQLEDAQIAKIDSIIDKARLQPSDRVLEIGSGWGALAIRAARRIGCHVTTITLSEQQFAHVSARIAAEGLQDKVEVKLIDYRDVTGAFDKIVSVEMLEAVGHEFLPVFFQQCEALLKPHGLVVLQVITMPEQRYRSYVKSSDWIQQYIFPGAVIPSLGAINDAATQHSALVLESTENIGPHYALTLREWRRRFLGALDKVRELGFDGYFCLTWEYYLAYCEAGFATRTINVHQLTMSRPNNARLIDTDGQMLRAADIPSGNQLRR